MFDSVDGSRPKTVFVFNTSDGGSCTPGLPDGLFSNQKYQHEENFQGLRVKIVDTFYGHLECFTDIHMGYFMAIWHLLCLLGTFFRFWCHAPRKIWQPCRTAAEPMSYEVFAKKWARA
jgi:hypothetical protein